MPRPGEDRSDVGGAVQFNNIGPVPLSSSFHGLSRFHGLPLSRTQYRTCPAFTDVPLSGPLSRTCPAFTDPCPAFTDPDLSRFHGPVPLSRFCPAFPLSRFPGSLFLVAFVA